MATYVFSHVLVFLCQFKSKDHVHYNAASWNICFDKGKEDNVAGWDVFYNWVRVIKFYVDILHFAIWFYVRSFFTII